MMRTLLNKLTSSTDDPDRMRRKQYVMMGGILAAGLSVLYLITRRPLDTFHESQKEDRKETARLETPFEAVNSRDVWVNRVQKEAEEAKAEAKAVREENQMMRKKLETLLMKGETLSGKQEGEGFSSPAASGVPPLLPEKDTQG